MPDIVLATINARYMHASFGLRYLHANLGELAPRAVIREYTLDVRAGDIAEAILRENPRIVGLGVYIWNARESLELVSLLARVAPDVRIILGGPEVSHELADQPIVALSDFVITGEGDTAFRELCERLLDGRLPLNKVIDGGTPDLETLILPYALYSDEDVARRVVYVEASRGCPYRCEFCLSSLDKTVRPFPLEAFLGEMQTLLDRGVRRFKFVDRTFNLDAVRSLAILEFFATNIDLGLFVHFELVPDRLPDALRSVIARFPPGSLQFEIGIQTFDDEVGKRISRRQDVGRTIANLKFLREDTHVHLHTDLIVGLPGESMESVGLGFDRLVGLGVQEVQVGVLKRLRGTPIARHTESFDLRFATTAPYEILSSDRVDFMTMNRLKRFSLAWDTVANSGNFRTTTPLIWSGESPFVSFLAFTDWLHARLGRVHGIALKRLTRALATYLVRERDLDPERVSASLREDFSLAGRKDPGPILPGDERSAELPVTMVGTPARQSRHSGAPE